MTTSSSSGCTSDRIAKSLALFVTASTVAAPAFELIIGAASVGGCGRTTLPAMAVAAAASLIAGQAAFLVSVWLQGGADAADATDNRCQSVARHLSCLLALLLAVQSLALNGLVLRKVWARDPASACGGLFDQSVTTFAGLSLTVAAIVAVAAAGCFCYRLRLRLRLLVRRRRRSSVSECEEALKI